MSIVTQKVNFKELSFLALFSLIFGSMMGSGVFDIPQNVSYKAGAIAVSIGWLITIIGILALSFAFMYLIKHRPDIKSGIYGYAKYGFGDYIGFNSAWGYALNALLANASYLVYICATLGNFALFKFLGQGNTVSSIVLESLLIWVVYFLIKRGIRSASIVNILITSIKILTLVVIIIIFIFGFSLAKFKSNFSFELQLGSIFEQVKSTMLVTVWDFTGIEAACIFAMRAKNMQDVAKATFLGAIVVCLIDAAVSILPFGILPGSAIRQMSTPSTAGILSVFYGVTSGEVVRIAVVISVLGALLTWTMLAMNILYLASDDKTMPKSFTKLNAKNVPINALLISSVAAQLFVIMAFFTSALYLAMIQLATSLILLPYLFAALFAVKVIVKQRKVDLLSVFKGILAVLYSIWLVYSGGMKYLALSSIFYLIGSILYFKARREYSSKLFQNKFEIAIYILLILVTIVSLTQWAPGIF